MAPRTLALSCVALVVLSACTDPARFDPSAPDRNQTRDGALIGAAVGAITGLAAGGDQKAKNAIVGAAIGAGAGAAIGNRLDQQEADLRQRLGNRGVAIVNTGESLIVTMPQDILFAVDSDVLRPDLESDLRNLAASLRDFPESTVRIVGHTDNTGSAAYNQGLSERRAGAVRAVLVDSDSGVAAARLAAVGRGEADPVADNLTDEGRRQNRRVEVIIRPTA